MCANIKYRIWKNTMQYFYLQNISSNIMEGKRRFIGDGGEAVLIEILLTNMEKWAKKRL